MVEKLRIVGAIALGKNNEFFTLNQVVHVTGLDRLAVRRVLEKLSREELILTIGRLPEYEQAKGRPRLAITYHVTSAKKLQERVSPKLKEDTAQDRMWSIIRNKAECDGSFTVKDLVVLAEAKRENARWYLKQLRRAGIVERLRRGGPGVEWALMKDMGPKRPAI